MKTIFDDKASSQDCLKKKEKKVPSTISLKSNIGRTWT